MVKKNVFITIACVLQITQVLSNFMTTPECNSQEKADIYLDMAVDMINKVKSSYPSYPAQARDLERNPLDCTDLLDSGHNKSGLYKIWPQNRLMQGQKLEVYCDMETDGGGWTVIQRRGNFSRPADYFYKGWKEYKEGFGDLEKDFWLGNDNIFALTNQKLYSVRFDLKDVENQRRYALYDKFWIDDENHKYTLHISDYSGDAGDSMIEQHDNAKFSTKDQKNNQPGEDCAQKYKGGWWYNSCHHSNLNGLYLRGKHESFADGVNWMTFKGYHESLDTTEIKIRPQSYRPSGQKTVPQR